MLIMRQAPWEMMTFLVLWSVHLVRWAILISIFCLSCYKRAPLASRAPFAIAKKIWWAIHPRIRNFGSHLTARPPVHPSVLTTGKPMLSVTLSSWCESLQTDNAHPCCGQLTAVKTGFLLTSITWLYRGLRCRPIEIMCFFMLSVDKLPVLNWLQALTSTGFCCNNGYKFMTVDSW